MFKNKGWVHTNIISISLYGIDGTLLESSNLNKIKYWCTLYFLIIKLLKTISL